MLSDWTSFSENWTNDWEALSSRFQQQTGDKCSSCQICKMSLLGRARYIFRGELASDGILYQEVSNSLDSFCDCFSDHRSILIRRIRYLSRLLQKAFDHGG